MNIIGNELLTRFEQIQYDDFYKDIFFDDLGHQELDSEQAFEKGKYIAIATVIRTMNKRDATGKHIVSSWNYFVYDGLDTLKQLVYDDQQHHSDEKHRLTIISPVSYAGKRRLSKNTRFLYALCVEIDNLRIDKYNSQVGLNDLLFQIDNQHHPRPTYIVASGTGVHLYYKFVKPVPCFANVKESLARYKHALTKKLWNRYVTDSYKPEQIQYQSVFQGFRMVGTRTKKGDVCEAYRTGEPVTLEYLNQFVAKKNAIDIIYKSELTRKEAKELYPEWYQKRVVEHDTSKGHWVCKRALYDWWLRRIAVEAVVGHRYYCLMCLCIYAVKCDIDYKELEQDCYRLMQRFETLTTDDSNHFTELDVEAALDIYRTKGDNLYTYPVSYIQSHSGIVIEPNKRNGRTQEQHVKYMRGIKNLKLELGEDVKGGRPKGTDKRRIVQEWKFDHPGGSKADCIRETGLSKPTVYKWWDVPYLDLRKKPPIDPRLDF